MRYSFVNIACVSSLLVIVSVFESAVDSEGIEVVKGISSPAGQETKVRTESPRASSARGKVTDIKLPFTFTIYTLIPDGKPQPGVRIKYLHPRAERGAAIVEMVVTSDEKGIAKFSVTQADIITDRYFWFSLGDDKFVGDCGVGISPVDNEYTYTFPVLPAEEFRFLVLDEKGKPIPNAKLWLT